MGNPPNLQIAEIGSVPFGLNPKQPKGVDITMFQTGWVSVFCLKKNGIWEICSYFPCWYEYVSTNMETVKQIEEMLFSSREGVGKQIVKGTYLSDAPRLAVVGVSKAIRRIPFEIEQSWKTSEIVEGTYQLQIRIGD